MTGCIICNARALCYNPAVMNGACATVGLDGFYFNQSTTGSGQYATQLWQTFQERDGAEPPVRLLCPRFSGQHTLDEDGQVHIAPPPFVRSSKPEKLWWEQRGLIRAANESSVQAIHVPYFSAPLGARQPVIVTIHDVIPFIIPQYRASLAMRVYLRLVSRAARAAAAIITDSECSRRDIERHLGIERSRITVTPLAADDRFRPLNDPDGEAEIRQRMGLPGPVIFNVGGLDIRKNVPLLIRAFAAALPDLDPDTRLVIAGHAHTGNERLYPPLNPVIEELGVKDRVVMPGRISEEDKVLLYNVADVYVFTSTYEGFGLSPLEAMKCGTPVICANRSSIPEVVGGVGVLVEPQVAKFAGAISAVMGDAQWRRRLAHQCLERASRFSWTRTAEQTRNVYRQVLEHH
jgi:glycosyltransferase involved in cell wall biosynthesis